MNSQSTLGLIAPSARWPRRYWWMIAAVVIALTALELWLFRGILAAYFPALDEIAYQGASTPIGGAIDPRQWFAHGFHGYFLPYPEWQPVTGDSWRPLVNVYYWVSYWLFGRHWDYPLVVGYAAHAAVVALVAALCRWTLRLPVSATLAAVAIALFNPALVQVDAVRDPLLIPRAIQFPNYQLEILAALLVILSLLALLRRRLAWFCLWASLAVLLRETAVVFPIAATLLVARRRGDEPRRDWRDLAWLSAPLVLWLVGVAYMALHAEYAFAPSPVGLLSQLPRRLLFWPTGMFQAPLSGLKVAASSRDFSALIRYGAELASNMAWWLALVAAVIYYRRNRNVAGAGMPMLMYAAGSLLLLAVLPPDVRLGYLWFALGPAAIFYALLQLRRGAVYVALLLIVLIVPQLHSLTAALSGPSVQTYALARRSAGQLAELLSNQPSSVQTAFLLDDMVVQTSSPEYFADLSGFHGRLVLINNIAPVPGCQPSTRSVQQYQLSDHGNGETWLTYEAADCYASPWVVPPLGLFDRQHSLQRGDSLSYTYPDLAADPGKPYDPGRRFTLRSSGPACAIAGACVWIGFNPATQKYYVLQ